MNHFHVIKWTQFDGTANVVTGYGKTSELAVEDARILATEQGWKPPKFWQWWRSRDTVLPIRGSYDICKKVRYSTKR